MLHFRPIFETLWKVLIIALNSTRFPFCLRIFKYSLVYLSNISFFVSIFIMEVRYPNY